MITKKLRGPLLKKRKSLLKKKSLVSKTPATPKPVVKLSPAPAPVVTVAYAGEVEVKACTKNLSLCQAYSSGWEVAVAHKESEGHYQQVNVWAYCKDYLNDVLYGHLFQVPTQIYGMTYNPKTDPPCDLDMLRVVVRDKTVPQDTFHNSCKNAVALLNKLEAKMGFSPTTVSKAKMTGAPACDEKTTVCLLQADKRWMHSIPMLSLFGIIARGGRTYAGQPDIVEYLKTVVGPDKSFLANAVNHATKKSEVFDFFMRENINIFNKDMKENWTIPEGISSVHNCGFAWWSNLQHPVVYNPNLKTAKTWKSLQAKVAEAV